MTVPLTLARYFARQTLLNIGLALFALTFLIFLVDLVELGRRAAGRSDIGMSTVLQLALLHVPYLSQRVMPYAVLLGSMLALGRLMRSSEIVAARAAGISTVQLLIPGIAVALSIGVVVIAAFNPFAAALLERYEQIEGRLLHDQVWGDLAVSNSGLWLRQADEAGESVIHASRIEPPGLHLRGVSIFRLERGDRFVERIDADAATLRDGYWELEDALITGPDRPAERLARYRFPTDLTVSRIQESFAAPETLSFWEIPEFVRLLEKAGFSSLKHRLHWHNTLAIPLLFAGMVLLGATFSLRLPRRGHTGLMIAVGVFAGFVLYVFSDVVLALGLSASVPAMLAAWSPALVTSLLGAGLLLYVREV